MQNIYKIHPSYLPKNFEVGQVLAAKTGRRQFKIIDKHLGSSFVQLRLLPVEERVSEQCLTGKLRAAPFQETLITSSIPTNEQTEELKAMFAQGAGIREIMRHFRRGHSVISNWLLMADLTLPPSGSSLARSAGEKLSLIHI
jgi:hypothetical protein